MNEAAVDVLRRNPELVGSSILTRSMDSTRQHTSGTHYRPYLDEWDALLHSRDVERIAAAVLADDEHGRALRVTSPLGFLLSDVQRKGVIRRAIGICAAT